MTPIGSDTSMVGTSSGARHEVSLPNELLELELTGEQVDEEPLQRAHAEDELVPDGVD